MFQVKKSLIPNKICKLFDNIVKKQNNVKLKLQYLNEFKNFINNTAYDDLFIMHDSNNRRSILHYVCLIDDISYLKILINKLNNVKNSAILEDFYNSRDIYLRTPIHYICKYGYLDHFIILESTGRINFNLIDSVGRSIIHYTLTSDNFYILEELVLKPNLLNLFDVCDNYDRSTLHYLVLNQSKNKKILSSMYFNLIKKEIIQSNLVNKQDINGRTPLHYCAIYSVDWIVNDLIKFDAKFNIYDFKLHKTALEYANTTINDIILLSYSNKKTEANKKIEKEITKEHIITEKIIKQHDSSNKLAKLTNKDHYNDLLKQLYDEIINLKPQNLNIYDGFVKEQKQKLIHFMDILQISKLKTINTSNVNYDYFTGTWINNITSTKELISKLNELEPLDAILLLYNIISPPDENKVKKLI